VPLSAAGERLGILHLQSAPGVEARAFGEVQMQSAHLAADSLALAWANVRLRESLREQAVRDPLTGLYNRRHMQASLERELRRAERNKKPIGIMMLDIDHFKEVNDKHGHDAGDAVLRELGRFLKEHTRGGDIACRLGGEEFVIILPEANLEQTAGRAEQHRRGFSAMRIDCNGRRIETPTLSIGIAAYPNHGTATGDLLRAADAALYLAKERGRNRVAVAE
jgi:diguanylate cyclase (GGDEF)-like protein